jgi:hypothetical protein
MATPQLAWLGSRFRTGGHTKLTLTDSNRTITNEEAYSSALKFEGALTAARTITFPACPGFAWKIHNATTGGYALTLRGPASNAVSVPHGATLEVYYDPDTGFKTFSASAVSGVGTFANRPAAGNAGRIYTTTDGPVQFIDDGTNWLPIIDGKTGAAQVYPASDFTWTNQASSASADIGGTVRLTTSGGGSGVCVLRRNIANQQSYTLTACVALGASTETDARVGVALVEAGGAPKLITFGYRHSTQTLQINTHATAGAALVSVASLTIQPRKNIWLRIVGDTANRTYYFSYDGVTYTYFYAETDGTYMTEAYAGLFARDEGAETAVASLLSWELS